MRRPPMPSRWPRSLAARAALVLGLGLAVAPLAAPFYARLMAPYYGLVASVVGDLCGWDIVGVVVADSDAGHGARLRLTGDIYARPTDRLPTARSVSDVAVGEVVETPLVYLGILCLWPLPRGVARWRLLALSLPGLLLLEALTTVAQLLHAMPALARMVAGLPDTVALVDRWTTFLSAGGGVVLDCLVAVLAGTLLARLLGRQPAR